MLALTIDNQSSTLMPPAEAEALAAKLNAEESDPAIRYSVLMVGPLAVVDVHEIPEDGIGMIYLGTL